MHILLAYSTRHFNPERPGEAGNGSAAILAGTLYRLLSRFGSVEYVDGLNPPQKLGRAHYDLLVSILGGIAPLCRLARFDTVCLFAVNMHPAERNRILDDFNAAYRVCDSHTLDKSIVSLAALDDVDRADAIFLVGNRATLQSFVAHGVEPRRLRCFNYASALPPCASLAADRPEGNHFVYAATEMCMRKGFDIVAELFTRAAREGFPFQLTVIGAEGGKTYAAKLARLKQELGARLRVEGWVPSSSERYPAILRQNDFILFPSLEEGQAGSVLDALACGLIPIVTPQTGIDCSPLGYLEPALHSEMNERILRHALALKPAAIQQLANETIAYYAARHLGWETALEEALRLLIETGRANPESAQAAEMTASPPPRRAGFVRRRIAGPGAWVLRFLCPSKQKRKRLYNYYRLSR